MPRQSEAAEPKAPPKAPVVPTPLPEHVYDLAGLPPKRARPRDYTDDERRQIIDWICAAVAEGGERNNFKTASAAAGLTRSTLFRWTSDDPALEKLWQSGRIWQTHAAVEDMIDLADRAVPGRDGNVEKVRLQVDARKFVVVKIAPRIYGDKLEVAGANGIPLIPPPLTRQDLGKLSVAELEQLEQLVQKATVMNVLPESDPVVPASAGALPASID